MGKWSDPSDVTVDKLVESRRDSLARKISGGRSSFRQTGMLILVEDAMG